MLMQDVLIMGIGIVMICMGRMAGIALLCASIVLLFVYRKSKLPALISSLACSITYICTDILFPIFRFTGSGQTLIGTTVTVLTGGDTLFMEKYIASAMVLTAISIIYNIFVLMLYLSQKKTQKQ